MSNRSCVWIVTMLLAAPAAYAEEQGGEEHEAHHPDAIQTQAAAEDNSPAPGLAGLPMREQMQAVRDRMQKIHENADSDELLDMLEDHVESLLDMMKMMHGMMAAQAVMEQGMMGGHKGGMGMMGGKGGMGMMGGKGGMGMMARHQSMVARMDMLENRLNLMQMMMDQMLQSQKALVDHLEDRLEEKTAKE